MLELSRARRGPGRGSAPCTVARTRRMTVTDNTGRPIGPGCARLGRGRPRRGPGPPPAGPEISRAGPAPPTGGPGWLGPGAGAGPVGAGPAGAGPAGAGPAGAGPAGAGRGIAAWVAGVRLRWLEFGVCAHRRESAGYRPPTSLQHLIRVRQQLCAFPGCGRPARRCDLDHTI